MNEFKNKIFRNEYNKSLAGVASGLAEGFEVDVTIVRLLFVLSTLFLPGSGLVVYIVLWIIAPVNRNVPQYPNFHKFNQSFDTNQSAGTDTAQSSDTSKSTATDVDTNEVKPKNTWEYQYKWNETDNDAFLPKNNFRNKHKSSTKLILGIVLICIGLQAVLRRLHVFNFFDHIEKIWPVFLIGLGVFLLMKYREKNSWESPFDGKFSKSEEKPPFDKTTDYQNNEHEKGETHS